MSEGSTRSAGLRLGPVVLAMIFLAVIGGGAGYSLGTFAKNHPSSASSGNQPGDQPTGGSDATAATTTTTTGATGPAPVRCPGHTENLANAGPLTQLLYLHTAKSEVWICRDGNGTLYYQGHSGRPGEDLQEHVNALYLTDVQHEGSGYVATNTDDNGAVTKYHVTSAQLIIEHVNGPKETQVAVP